jgi:DNA helicase HerA-like ATPase
MQMGSDQGFYLGKVYDLKESKLTDEVLQYDPPDLTTHAIVTGMTGSGKTGLCVGLLEEAALQGIPAILVDPKGDLTNLLLTFPDLKRGL